MPTREFDLNIERVLEKLASPEKVVGKFGVGLKDALATFDRRGVGVRIRSRYDDISAKQAKHGFGDITTLHAVIADPSDAEMVGTDVELSGVADEDAEAAKALFRHYAGDEVLEETEYGVVLKRPKWEARIYVNCLRVPRSSTTPQLFGVKARPRCNGGLWLPTRRVGPWKSSARHGQQQRPPGSTRPA